MIGAALLPRGDLAIALIQVADTRASRTHANLRPTAEGLLLTDMRSKHGTFVNGKLTQSATLLDGDVIGIGDCKLVYRREAKFATDDAQRAKAIDAAMTGETSADFGAMARKVISECGGDLNEASKRLGLPVDVLKNLLKTN